MLTVKILYDQALNKELKEAKQRMQSLLEERDALGLENQELMKKKAKLELDIKDIQDEMEGNTNLRVCQTFSAFYLI